MDRIARPVKITLLVVGMAWTVSKSSPCQAQQQPVTLPAGWQQMSPTDFAAAIRTLFDQGTFKKLSSTDQLAAADRGKALFLPIDISSTSLSYQTLEMLHWVCRNDLDQPDIDKTASALIARQDGWTGKPYAEIRAKIAMMMRVRVPDANQINEGRRWVLGGGTMDQIPKADLKYEIVRKIFSDVQIVNGSFSVQWTGVLNAPQSGDYTFSISPVNVNNGYNQSPVKLTMTVSIAGQNLLTSTRSTQADPSIPGYRQNPVNQADWTSQSMPVTLTAGTPVSLTVNLTVDAMSGLPSGALHAMLYWQGPGISKSIVPTANLTEPDAGKPGLKAKYSWIAQGKPQTLTRIDPNIDFAWTVTPLLLSQDASVADQAAAEMWQTMTSTDYITATIGPPVKLHPFLKDADEAAAGMITSRREAFLNLLLQNPPLLDPLDTKLMVRFYDSFRMGTPDKALDVFGVWAARNADLGCEISNDPSFEGDARLSLARLAIETTQHLPDQATRLQNEFLQLPDGRCCLPVAYTLGYSYLGRRKRSDWIAFLDAKIGDPSVVGDLRVNWLLARAHAEELRQTSSHHYPNHYPYPTNWPLAGRKFLEQAIQSAQTAQAKLRAAKEIAGRLASAQRFQAAKDALQPLSNTLPDDQKPVLAGWLAQLDGFLTAANQANQNRQAVARQSYLATLKARRAQAASQGDTDAQNRYDALISAVTAKQ
jgi:hypothetical protein